MAALDIVWAAYTINVQKFRAGAAGMYASLIMALTALITISYVDNPWIIIPVMAGAFVGTVIGVRLQLPY